MRRLLLILLVALAGVAFASAAGANETPEFRLLLQDHKFVPATLKVPAGVKFKVLVTNRNTMPSEFESSDFKREKIVLPNSTITVFVGPLDKGSYKFFDDFHPSTAGTLVVE